MAVASSDLPGRLAARGQGSRLRLRRWAEGYVLVLPAIALILLMTVYPVVQTLHFSVSRVQLPTFNTTFVGFANFARILSDPETWPLLQRTVVWVVGTVALRMALGLGAALIFNANVRGTVWMRVLAILPWTIPSVVGANLWRWILQTDTGVLNQSLRSWGLGDWALNWLADPDTAMLAVIVAYSWSGFPFVMLLILARMQGIPEELYDAAKVDGANWWQSFRYITMPSLKGVLIVALILEVVSGINSFDTLVIMTGGGPADATRIWGLEIYERGFTNFNLGGASALSVLMFGGVLLLFVVYGVLSRSLGRKGDAAA
ncbi:MAG TPA: sugar ABC transporter permease [Geminicoccaceae bacterium]|nr:sugar ABC transporter permease [Geminicoccus sp.]HMU49682.1 sugar ABC transporter permease [Geminicoccaceae bacterium]